MKILVVAGPAGCGKTTFARYLAHIAGCETISTDDYIEKGIQWDDVPGAVMEDLKGTWKYYPDDPFVIIEGVRALSVIKHNNLQDQVLRVWWGEYDPKKPNCEGLRTRQWDLLTEMQLEMKYFSRIDLS